MNPGIFYLYEYNNTQKLRNAGFLKITRYYHACTLQLNARGIPVSYTDSVKLYVFYMENGQAETAVLTEIPCTNHALSARMTSAESQFPGGHPLEKVDGFFLRLPNGHILAAAASGMVIDAEKLLSASDESLSKESDSVSDSSSTEENRSASNGSLTTENDSVSDGPLTVENDSASGDSLTEESNSASGDSSTKENTSASGGSSTVENDSASGDSSTRKNDSASGDSLVLEHVPGSMETVEKLSDMGRSASGESIPQDSPTSVQLEAESVQECPANEYTAQASSAEASSAATQDTSAETDSAATQDTSIGQGASAEEDAPQDASAAQDISTDEGTSQDISAGKDASQGISAAQNSPQQNVKKIQRSELSILPRKYWHLANNSFLLHGYHNYNHLILIQKDGHYWLGVPGIYDPHEARAARLFGFPQFTDSYNRYLQLTDEECDPQGNFGYWCCYLK